ncbi:LacI family transcriptional regulator [Thalassobacillus cyri]|uniref:Catabolite control protein A n=1 Tax=Thalassobacillus cyri TaxID=571932 RepID=A0A1H4DKQ0_9BACI|nr:LacI family DNA-binding transcriptional regulator [Thalassobacillus cyri]SEA73069.1 LacI family transcriptional regulator [Thalassobacillus cyri]
MATIRDVAKQAGVSVATVSRVINKLERVNPDTKQKVLDAIEKLNYKPNDVARSLYQRKSKMIALIVPDITNPYFPELARAVEDVANRSDYTFVLCNSDDSEQKERQYMQVLRQKQVDGFIVVTSTLAYEHIKDLNVPVVALDRIIDRKVPAVTVNNNDGAKTAVQHLLDIGCKRIAHISGPDDVDNAMQRKQGYLDVVSHYEWFEPGMVQNGDYHMDQSEQAMMKLLKAYPDIDGVFAGNDLMAVGALKALKKSGKKVPDEISVVGFDGISLGELTTPSITTVKQPIYKIGEQAARMLIDKINDPTTEQENVEYDVTFMERESTKRKEG